MGAVTKMDGTPLDQRKLPHNIDAEQRVLGAIFNENDWLAGIANHVVADDFNDPLHGEMFDTARQMIESGRAANPVTLKQYLGEIMVGNVSCFDYMMELWNVAPKKQFDAIEFAKIVKDNAIKRATLNFLRDAEQRIEEGHPADSGIVLLDYCEAGLASIRPMRAGTSGFVSFDKSAQKAVDIASSAYQRGAVLPGLSTGLKAVDDVLGGLQKTDMIVIAGRPAMGKSAIATNIAYAVARDLLVQREAGEKTGVVGVISLEMSDDQVAGRILSERSYISTHRLRRGGVSESEIERFANAAEELRSLPIETDSTPNLSISQIAMRARHLAKRKGLALLIVDYIQIIEGGARKRENRVQELAEITAGLKGLAKELEVPVVALAQVGRQVEQRPDKRPRLSDLKESGTIEQDADVVMFLYRHEYYLKPEEPKPGTEDHVRWQDEMDRCRGRAEIIVAKNRHGPSDTVHVGYDATVTKFKDELPDDIAAAPREKRDRQEVRRFKDGSLEALGVLRGLAITASVENDGHVDTQKGARLVPYRLWKTKCADQSLDPDRSDASITTKMEAWVNDLRGMVNGQQKWPALVARGRSGDEIYVWLTEAGAK